MMGEGAVDLSTLREASFPGMAKFAHFVDPEHESCFTCNSRLMAVRPLLVTVNFVLLEATARVDDKFVIMPEAWLVSPRKHLVEFLDMPDDWTRSVKEAVRFLGIGKPFCTSDNWGREAGQTIAHGHTWIIGRGWAEDGLLSQNMGLATILLRIRQHGIVLPS
jgi:diadenosine tetraphosphate (Ap4A) HIT family hydrolase